jgi:hypothetical protein
MIGKEHDPREFQQPRFSERLKLEKEFLKWAKENKANACPMNVIGWLESRYWLVKKEG